MSDIWPFDVKRKMSYAVAEPIRTFNCLLLMPFENRFDQVADIIKNTVLKVLEVLDMDKQISSGDLPQIERLDWVTSAGVIQQEIWERIINADIVFCDITGFNPNVMFEAGVSASWKDMTQVVFIKDRFFKQQSAFDIAPIRYTEYELTSDGIITFQYKIAKLIQDVLIGFPDSQQSIAPILKLPIEIDFSDGRDDLRIYTPPYSHRRVSKGALEFGASRSFTHSWASLGKSLFLNFDLEFCARFVNPVLDEPWIGVALRSQHYYANYSHLFYINKNGLVVITEPNEDPPSFYKDNILRERTFIDHTKDDHYFRASFTDSTLRVRVDDFHHEFKLKDLKKVYGQGLIRFQSWGTWMSINRLKIVEAIES